MSNLHLIYVEITTDKHNYIITVLCLQFDCGVHSIRIYCRYAYVNFKHYHLQISYTFLSIELAKTIYSLSVVWLYSFAVQPKGNVAYILAHLTVKECSVEGFARSRKLWKPIQFCLKVSRKGKKQIVFNITSWIDGSCFIESLFVCT